MEDKLLQILKSLRSMEPEQDFMARSRHAILSSPRGNHHLASFKIRFWESLKFSGALTLASVLLFILFGGLTFFHINNLAPTLLTSFNDEKLMAESTAVDFEIKLQEIKYYEKSAQEVAAALDELLKDGDKKL